MTTPNAGPHGLRTLSLRAKLAVTTVAAVVAVLGTSTYLSFRFWREEALAAGEQQALIAASATRAAVESSLRSGRVEVARRNLRRLLDGGTVTEARVWSHDHTILLSIDPAEEGTKAPNVWIPSPSDLGRSGIAQRASDDGSARAFIPVASADAAMLEVAVHDPVGLAAMRRGAHLAIGLTAVSVLAVLFMVATMFEREVVAPIHRVEHLFPVESTADEGDEVRGLEKRVVRLVAKEREAEALAEERNRLLTQQDGLARVGGLAAEMAHEFKRPLASIRMAIGVLDQEYALEAQGRSMLDAVNQQLEKLSETMEDLFSLARPVELDAERVDLSEVLDGALLQVAEPMGAAAVRVVRSYPDDLVLRGDERRLGQAFANLLTNAIEAMPAGGVLSVSAEGTEDGRVVVTVRDTGPGLDPEEARLVLRPFYSTKPFGTGLGLSVVARVVDAHHGTLSIMGDASGTTVLVELPLASDSHGAGTEDS